jgi:hypothetical protein
MNNKIKVKLLTFFRCGRFGIDFDSTSKDWFDCHFAKATDKSYLGSNLSIWRYDTVEFHFDGDNLFQIWCDNLEQLSSNRRISFDKWILQHPLRLTLNYVIKHLQQENITYQIDECLDNDRQTLLLPSSGVRLLFEDNKMVAFHLSYHHF